jgi:presenilin-like A22 family membrane protease
MAGGILLGILFAIAKFFFPSIKNIATILATAGVGVVFGISLGVVPVIILLLLLSIYDYIAVFKTRHMVEMANFMMKKELSFTVTARTYIPALKKEARIDLGSGDIIAPIMFEVSALHLSPLASLLVFVGAVSSLSLFLFLAYRKRMVLPALPPITFGMILLFLVGHIAGAY